MAVRNLRISYTSQNDDHGLVMEDPSGLIQSVQAISLSWPHISIQIHPTEYQPNRNAKSHLSLTPEPPEGEQEETPAEEVAGWKILLPRGLRKLRAPCQLANTPKCRFKVGGGGGGQSSGSCTITLASQPPQQVLEGLCREGAEAGASQLQNPGLDWRPHILGSLLRFR